MLPLRDQLPTRTFPFVNYLLILANIVVFLWERTVIASGVDPQRLVMVYGLVPARAFADPQVGVITLFTSMFMHDPTGFLHIGGNMLYLWIFGDNVEDAMGHFRYLVFYLLGGTCAAFAQTIVDPHSMLPMVGASGAIASVLAAYVFLYPRSPITVVNPLIWTIWALLIWGLTWELPAWFVIALWFTAQLFSAFTVQAGGGVAFLAHVGGFVGGAMLLRTFMAGRVRLDDYARWQQFARRRSRSEARDSW